MNPLVRRAGALATLALAAFLSSCAAPAPRPTPIADRQIDVAGRCAQTEADGFREDATLRVSANQVQALDWRVWIGKRGSCSFSLDQFRQIRSRPHIELAARDGSACRLMVWQDPRRITLAHANCENSCTPGVYEEAWPVAFDPRSGGCGRLE